MPNQRSLAVLAIYPPAAAVTTNTNAAAVDLAPYANVGRREMKAVFGAVMQSGTTAVVMKIQENTTSGAGDGGWSDISGATKTLTTEGGLNTTNTIHFSTTKRYIRAVATLSGTTLSAQPFGIALAEKRVTTN